MGDALARRKFLSRRFLTLDARGSEVSKQELPSPSAHILEPIDPDGDGNDEFLLDSAEGLLVVGLGMKEARARRPVRAPDGLWYPSSASARPDAGVHGPALGRGGPPGPGEDDRPRLLDPGDADRRPLWLAGNPDAAVCRSALPVLSTGRYDAPLGAPARPRLARDDPRWARPLPWIEPIRRVLDPRLLVAAIGLAMISVIAPIAIVRLAARRWPWSLRLLMALPIAAAIPLAVFQARDSLLPERIGPIPATARPVFLLGTLAGLPILIYTGSVVSSLFRRRWRHPLERLGLTIVASSIVAAAWIGIDRRAIPPIEHYSRSEWYLVAVPGAYVVGLVILGGWSLRGIYRGIMRLGIRRTARPVDAVPARSTM
jgi:hypothetical protein